MPNSKLDRRLGSKLRCALPLALALTMGGAGISAALADQNSANQYLRLLADAESIAEYNTVIERQIGAQGGELQNLEAQIATLDQTAADVPGLLQRMFEQLEQFVATDLPFIDPISDRNARIERIRQLMESETASQGERFRRLMEAYQIEIDYGRSMADYKATLPDGRDAEFVRVGRITLLYLTTDGKEAGYWDKQRGEWVIDNRYQSVVSKALRMARKELAPDVVDVPVPAPKEVGS